MSRLSRRRFLKEAAAVASAACVAPSALARSGASKTETMRGAEAMEAALERLAKTGPEYHGRLANHGPMAAEALVVMDRPDAVVPWVDYYRGRLHEHPAGARRIDPEQWREALGQGDRVGDWIVFSSTGAWTRSRGDRFSPSGCLGSRPESSPPRFTGSFARRTRCGASGAAKESSAF